MSSSFRYTLMKLRTLPSAVKICWRRSGYRPASASSASPTVAPETVTAFSLAVNWRSGVGIRIFGILVLQLLSCGFCTGEIRQPAIGVMERAVLHRQHHERIPGARILQIGFREVGVA